MGYALISVRIHSFIHYICALLFLLFDFTFFFFGLYKLLTYIRSPTIDINFLSLFMIFLPLYASLFFTSYVPNVCFHAISLLSPVSFFFFTSALFSTLSHFFFCKAWLVHAWSWSQTMISCLLASFVHASHFSPFIWLSLPLSSQQISWEEGGWNQL
jgi:hypothetical protein